MQSNTAVAENEDINIASFSAENRKSDQFTIVDGHYIGHDGFVVPKNFDEFHERFPEYVHDWLKRHADRSTPKEDVEDWTQDLLIHLRCLPTISKQGVWQGGRRADVRSEQTLRSEARFFNYINLCLANKFRSMHSRRMKNPLCCPGKLSFAADWKDTDRVQVDDEFCHWHSEHLRKRCQRQERQRDARQALAEFSDFVRREDSTVLPAMEAIASTATSGAAAELLSTTAADFCRMHSRLRQLARCFQNGKPVPRRRKSYRKRIVKTRILQTNML